MERIPPTSQSRTRAALALGALLAGSAGVAADAREFTRSAPRARPVIVPVRVQGVGPFPFLLDTGADTTVVHTDLARRLRLTPTARIELVTVAGARFVPQGHADLAIGETAVGRLDVLIHDLAAARAHDGRIAGILGRNALGSAPFTIDHERGRLVLGTSAPRGAVRYDDRDGRPVIDARLRCGGPPLRLALDSGLNGLILFERARAWPVVTSGGVAALTNAGTAWLRTGRVESLCVGRARLLDLPVAVQGGAGADGRPEDGLLPTGLFARVHVDPRAKTVTLEPW
jgi:hypothetical protein